MVKYFLHFQFVIFTDEGGPCSHDVHHDGVGLAGVEGFCEYFLIGDVGDGLMESFLHLGQNTLK